MFKIEVTNEVTGRTFGPVNKPLQEKDEYVAKQIAKQSSWGKSERNIDEENMSEELRDRIISTENIPALGVEGEDDYQPARIVHLVKADYVITETDMSAQVAAEEAASQVIKTERNNLRGVLNNLDTLLDKRANETTAEYRTRRAKLEQRLWKRLFKDVNGE